MHPYGLDIAVVSLWAWWQSVSGMLPYLDGVESPARLLMMIVVVVAAVVVVGDHSVVWRLVVSTWLRFNAEVTWSTRVPLETVHQYMYGRCVATVVFK